MATMTELPPIVDEKSRILILGSEPGKRALQTGQYYSHPDNKFWVILYNVFGGTYTEDYGKRKEFVLKHKIALFDVLISCRKPSEEGGSIYDEVANDFEDFYRQYPDIKYVFFNGRLASDMYIDHVGWKKHKINHLTLPSTSSADHKLSLEEKVREWKNIKNYLEELEKGDEILFEI
jgi:hypoxanthine-DNA glycosylase